jgi:enterochelin esterase-like enzyme
MSLTGTAFAWLVSVVTVAAFAAVVVFWPRVATMSVRRVAARTGMLLGVNLLVLLTAAVQLNDQFLFFADWADLGGAIGGTTTTSDLHRGGSAQGAESAKVTGPAATPQAGASLAPLPPGSKIQDGVMSYTVTGTMSGITAQVLVTLPPGYDPTAASTAYPVLETFAGYPGSMTQWVKTMRIQSNLADAVAAKKLRQVIVVSPQAEIPAGQDSECVDGGTGNPAVETWLTRDVPEWVATHFRVSTERGSWATIGLSAGGWCAAMAAMLHPAQYGGAIVMGGYFRPDFSSSYEPYPPRSDLAKRYDLVALTRKSPPALAMWVETSHADPVSYQSASELLKEARPPLSMTDIVLQNAGHRIGVWQGLLPTALAWLGSSLPGFHP